MSGSQNISTDKARILVADDDRLILATLSKGLRQSGYEVTEAASGEEALRLALERQPELMLLDVRMPGMSGLEVAKQLSQTSTIPFLFLSAYGDAEIVKEAAEFGALGYLVKPVDISQVVAAIEAALARAREIHKLRETEMQLSHALNASRETSMAVGLLMERHRMDRNTAFEALRDHARSRRRKIADVAEELLKSAEALNAVIPDPSRGRPDPR